MKLYLVRHGETEENVDGILMGHHHGVLTEKGKAQARETAILLKDEKFSHIYSSDLNRCVDTAELIKEFHPDTPLTFTKDLRERNLGIFQGQQSKVADWDSLPGDEDDQKPENGESLKELRTRALSYIKELHEVHRNDTVLLISHNGWIKQVISHYSGVASKDMPSVKNAEVIKVRVANDLSGILL